MRERVEIGVLIPPIFFALIGLAAITCGFSAPENAEVRCDGKYIRYVEDGTPVRSEDGKFLTCGNDDVVVER